LDRLVDSLVRPKHTVPDFRPAPSQRPRVRGLKLQLSQDFVCVEVFRANPPRGRDGFDLTANAKLVHAKPAFFDPKRIHRS
jgi:hypothetical protein